MGDYLGGGAAHDDPFQGVKIGAADNNAVELASLGFGDDETINSLAVCSALEETTRGIRIRPAI